MIRIANLKLSPFEPEEKIREVAAKHLKIKPEEIISFNIYKKSVDARRKNDIYYIYTIDAEVKSEDKYLKLPNVSKASVFHYEYMKASPQKRPVVIGFGPAGMFAALILAEGGAKPIVLERGKSVEERTADVEALKTKGILNTSSNIQFGEGGAGTFSDGKLTTGIKDKACRLVLETFVEHGAPKEILYLAKPHIGTDKLVTVVASIRKRIIELGGEVRFSSAVTDFHIENNSVKGVFCNGEYIESHHIVLAIGHSARDTFYKLYDRGFSLEQKPFAVGVRIEHLRKDINRANYGKFADVLPAASYKLVSRASGTGVYTFCMCPGGEVVPAASEENTVVVNGMSRFSRDMANSNSALLVGISPDGTDNPLSGVELQRRMEKAAYKLGGGGYKAPVQLAGDFIKGISSKNLGDIYPSYKPGFTLCDLRECLPDEVSAALGPAILDMGRQIEGFDRYDAVLTGVESRSSSPVRILRNEARQSVKYSGIYPCGEGAGYAGGIVSAAVDGIHCAEAILDHRKSRSTASNKK